MRFGLWMLYALWIGAWGLIFFMVMQTARAPVAGQVAVVMVCTAIVAGGTIWLLFGPDP